jgi:hypothetical protein
LDFFLTKTSKEMKQFYYTIAEIPDPKENALQIRFGDVKKIIFEGWKSLARMVAEMEPETFSISLCFLYSPMLDNGVQGRLKLWIKTETDDENISDSIIMNGPVSEFYSPKKVHNFDPRIPWEKFGSIAEVIRRIDLVESYVSKSENSRVVPKSLYQSLLQFEAEEKNDFMPFDRMVSGFKSEVFIELCFKITESIRDLKSIYEKIGVYSRINEGVYADPVSFDDEYRKKYGFKKDHFADEARRELEDIAKNLRKPQLAFFIRVFGKTRPEVQLLASNIAESSFKEGAYRILSIDKKNIAFDAYQALAVKSDFIHEWQHSPDVGNALWKFTRMANVDELAGVFRMPVASSVSPKTIRKKTDPELILFDKDNNRIPSLLLGDDMETGDSAIRNSKDSLADLFDTTSQNCIEHRLKLEDLKKHMFICGVPGSGKTTAIFNILAQLHRYKVPFLVIEPAKTEYRILKTLKEHPLPELAELGKNLRIYTPGNEDVSPFRINPFEYPEGISLGEHINNLMNCFKSAMDLPMDSALPALLGRAVEDVYDGYPAGEFPFMEDLVKKVKELMDSPDLNYDKEIKGNLRTAIEVRLSPLVSKKRSIGSIFSKDDIAPSIKDLLTENVIIEMDSLDTEQANLLTLFILTSAREAIKTTRVSGEKLRHVIVLEEAHNLVANIPEGSNPDDPRKRAADYITRMLAEMRALAEGIVVADQLPSAVAPSVIKNTGTKLAHRLTSMDDRLEVGYTMLIGGAEVEEFARLKPGEAFYYTVDLYRPRRIKCIDSNQFLGFEGDKRYPPTNKKLYNLIEAEDWFRKSAIRKLEGEIKSKNEYILTISQKFNIKEEEINLITEDYKKGEYVKEKLERFHQDFFVPFIDTFINFDKSLDNLKKRVENISLSLPFAQELNLLQTETDKLVRRINKSKYIIMNIANGGVFSEK